MERAMTAAGHAAKMNAREAKAQRLGASLAGRFLTAVRDMTPEQWEAEAREAGVNPPSTETVARVFEILKGRLS
jgi:hypothetical protein